MKQVLLLVEGQTEETFVNRVLNPYFQQLAPGVPAFHSINGSRNWNSSIPEIQPFEPPFIRKRFNFIQSRYKKVSLSFL